MRTFYHVDPFSGDLVYCHKARCARTAAMKSATRGHLTAHIIDNDLGKLHVYDTHVRDATDAEATAYSIQHGIKKKPVAYKKDYKRIGVIKGLDPKSWQPYMVLDAIAR